MTRASSFTHGFHLLFNQRGACVTGFKLFYKYKLIVRLNLKFCFIENFVSLRAPGCWLERQGVGQSARVMARAVGCWLERQGAG